VPGPTVNSQISLIEKIQSFSNNTADKYVEDRLKMRNLQHRFLDANSSDRIYNFLKSNSVLTY
jgi:hypothetical protein